MRDPFAIAGPALLSFSGGRTSALMLYRVAAAGHGPGAPALPAEVFALFANTGKEREQTLVFVRECGERWGVPVHWVERTPGGGVREVDFASASRQGEPFAELIRERRFLPHPRARFCTTELKIRPMKQWMLARGFEHWTNVVGLRADEPWRVANLSATEGKERWDYAFPLYTAGVRKTDVRAFWRAQPFDLQLEEWEGNCDLCYLKGQAKRRRIIADRPDLAEWWISRERETGGTFRADAPSYAALAEAERSQLRMEFSAPESAESADDLFDCVCSE